MPGLRGDLVHWPAGEVNRRAHEAVPILPLSLVDWIAQGQRQQIRTVTHRTVQVRYYQLWKNYTKVYFSFEEIHILLSSQQFTTGCISFSVDGGFSNWGSWGTCTVTCGGGSSIRRLDRGVKWVHFLGGVSRSKVNARAMRGKRVRGKLYSDQAPFVVCRLSPIPVSAIRWRINPNPPSPYSRICSFSTLFWSICRLYAIPLLVFKTFFPEF